MWGHLSWVAWISWSNSASNFKHTCFAARCGIYCSHYARHALIGCSCFAWRSKLAANAFATFCLSATQKLSWYLWAVADLDTKCLAQPGETHSFKCFVALSKDCFQCLTLAIVQGQPCGACGARTSSKTAHICNIMFHLCFLDLASFSISLGLTPESTATTSSSRTTRISSTFFTSLGPPDPMNLNRTPASQASCSIFQASTSWMTKPEVQDVDLGDYLQDKVAHGQMPAAAIPLT